jgi:hypothetical protein
MKTAAKSSPLTLPPPTHEQITQRAHRLWIEAGRPEGQAREHWLEAERQLRDPSGKRGRSNILSREERESEERVGGLPAAPRDPRFQSGERL